MPIGCEDENNHLGVAYLVHQAMLLRDAPAPTLTLPAFQLFRMICAGTRVLLELGYQFQRLAVCRGFGAVETQ